MPGLISQVASSIRRYLPAIPGKATPGPIPKPEGYLPGTRIPMFTGWSGDDLDSATPADMYTRQPYLRLVVDFLAQNIAQLGIGIYDRVADDDRTRITSGPIYNLFQRPNKTTTRYELIRGLVADYALHDRSYWFVSTTTDTTYPYALTALPAQWVTPVYDPAVNLLTASAYDIQINGQTVRVPLESVIEFHGWRPDGLECGVSPVATLKAILREQMSATTFRQQMWDRGGRVGSFITRPVTAPEWSAEAAKQFREDWMATWAAGGSKPGGTPILEEGMEMKRVGFSAHEEEFIESSKLALTTVASVYHVNPVMVGLLDNANYSNVREFRKMLYGDTLGPWLSMIEGRINTFLLPQLGAPPTYYAEFNIAEKLQGSFEEQAAVMSTLVGRPIMSANEGRGRFNLPAIDDPGADELIVPLNVTLGGQASPQDGGAATGTQDQLAAPVPMSKALPAPVAAAVQPARKDSFIPPERAEDPAEKAAQAVLENFFGRQSRSVLAALEAGRDDWWNDKRWDRELTADLNSFGMDVINRLGPKTAAELGFSETDFDPGRVQDFAAAIAEARAGAINSTTRDQIKAAQQDLDDWDEDSDEDEPAGPAGVFEEAKSSRAAQMATTLATTYINISTTEAARQVAGDTATKTWRVRSGNPRPSHAAMDGEEVGIDDVFSNGMAWPGDASGNGDADEIANCQCDVEIKVP